MGIKYNPFTGKLDFTGLKQDLTGYATETWVGEQGYLIDETDPVFSASHAFNITETDITNLGNLSGINTGDQDLSGLVPYTGATEDLDLGTNSLKVGTPAGDYRVNVGGVLATDIVNSDNGYRVLLVTRPTFTNSNLALITGEGGNLDASATYHYSVTFVTAVGETNIQSGSASIATTADDRKVRVTIPVSSDYRVTARKIYRSVGGGGQYSNYLIATINDNTTTTFDDNVPNTTSGANSYFRDNTTVKWLSGSSTFMTPGANATRFGISAGSDSATGGRNSFFGAQTFSNISTGSDNVGVGGGVGYTCNPGGCTAVGQYAMGALQGTKTSITALGYQALFGSYSDASINPDYSVGIGRSAGAFGLGRFSVAVGYQSGQYVYSVNGYNTFTGYQSGKGVSGQSDGRFNTTNGALSGFGLTRGGNNIFFGAHSGKYSTTESGEFFINSYDRTDRAGEIANSIIYGKQTINGVGQELFVNATLQAQAYKSSDGTAGLTKDMVILDGDGTTTHTLSFKNGLLVAHTAV